jgi:oligopeptide/dipeptide ABC transporter, ATP-binding protein, C-terminal domain
MNEEKQPLVVFDQVQKLYPVGKHMVRAVDGVSFHINEGECFGLVGESGSGKSTCAGLLVGLEDVTSGKIIYRDIEMSGMTAKERRGLSKELQMVFQDPFASLNPRKTVEELIGLPLKVHTKLNAEQRRQRIIDVLTQVGLTPADQMLDRYPHAFSGGQRQRIAIARALVSNPRFIVADEPVSALDVSIRSQVLNVLLDLKNELSLTFLLISHDLSTIRYICDRIGILYLGQMVELTDKDRIVAPEHPYTELLLSALLLPDASTRLAPLAQVDRSEEDIPEGGCRFYRRCPYGSARCITEMPKPREINGVTVACHHPRSERTAAAW